MRPRVSISQLGQLSPLYRLHLKSVLIQSGVTVCTSALCFVRPTLTGIQEWGFSWLNYVLKAVAWGYKVKIGYTRPPSVLLEPQWPPRSSWDTQGYVRRSFSWMPFSQTSPRPTPSLRHVFVHTSASQGCLFRPNCSCPSTSLRSDSLLLGFFSIVLTTLCYLYSSLIYNAYCLFSVTLPCMINFLRAGIYVSSLESVAQAAGTAGAQ